MNRAHVGTLLAAGMLLALVSERTHAVIVLNNGDQVPLTTLLAPGSDRKFQVADKLFTVESFTSNQFVPSQITVVGYAHPTHLLEYGFDLTGGFGDASPGDVIIHEFNIQYTVEIAPGFAGYAIVDNHLLFNGNASGAPGSYARVDESVINPLNGQLIGQKSVFDIVNTSGPNTTQLQDQLNWPIPGYQILEINKDVKFLAVTAGSTASASFVRQTFSQIPAPGAMMLLSAGSILAMRRRR